MVMSCCRKSMTWVLQLMSYLKVLHCLIFFVQAQDDPFAAGQFYSSWFRALTSQDAKKHCLVAVLDNVAKYVSDEEYQRVVMSLSKLSTRQTEIFMRKEATQPARQRPFYYSSNYSLNSSKKSVARDTLGIKRQKSHAVMRKIPLFLEKIKK